jgi:hypothetical protein
MKKFIKENSELILKILDVQGFNKKKLEKIKELSNNKEFEFNFTGSCPCGFYLETTLKDTIHSLDKFEEYIKQKSFYEKGTRILRNVTSDENYKVIFNHGNFNSELIVYFNNP